MARRGCLISMGVDNAAFDGDPIPEVARILRKLADDLEAGVDQSDCPGEIFIRLRDINGNTVGRAMLSVRSPE